MTQATQPLPLPSLASYSLLGKSGLRVSPLCLGTMTFGTEWGWGAAAEMRIPAGLEHRFRQDLSGHSGRT